MASGYGGQAGNAAPPNTAPEPLHKLHSRHCVSLKRLRRLSEFCTRSLVGRQAALPTVRSREEAISSPGGKLPSEEIAAFPPYMPAETN